MKISDEDLLLAAKAAGVTPGTVTLCNIVTWLWNPVDKDVDSFQLRRALRKYGLTVLVGTGCNVSVAAFNGCDTFEDFEEGRDSRAATRLAIFRAAVLIGRAMP